MRKLLKTLFPSNSPSAAHLKLCPHHPLPDLTRSTEVPTLPYSTDECKSCQEHICHVCSDQHVHRHCSVELGVVKDLGLGVEQSFNLGDLIKVDLEELRCICGKKLGSSAAICAACGMASCSEACHNMWEQAGHCVFSKNFYSKPADASMRSILFSNIQKLRETGMQEWSVANRSSTNMVCCYVSSSSPQVYLQRGFRNYGRPNEQLVSRMEVMPRTIDYYTHYDRRCDCACEECEIRGVHANTNCQASCHNFDFDHLVRESMKPEAHKQCTCTCSFCTAGIVVSTHRVIDCMPYCKRSSYSRVI